VDEVFVKDVERQVESADMDAFDDLFGTDRLVKSLKKLIDVHQD
jgi:hypothetical protein